MSNPSHNPADEHEQILTVICPTCDEELQIPEDTWEEFVLGDVLVCDACGAQLEVISKEPPEFELLAEFVDCPDCGAEIEVTDAMLEAGTAQCPSCNAKFILETESDEPKN